MKTNFNISFIVIILFFVLFIILIFITRCKQNQIRHVDKIDKINEISKNNNIENFNYDDKETERYTKINNIFEKIKKFFIEDFEKNLKCKLEKDNIKLLEKNFNYIANCCMQKILQIYKNNYDFIYRELQNFSHVIEYSLQKGIDLNNCVQENQIQSIYYILNNLKISKKDDISYNILIKKIINYVLNNNIKFGFKKCDYLKFCEFDIEEIKILNNFKLY